MEPAEYRPSSPASRSASRWARIMSRVVARAAAISWRWASEFFHASVVRAAETT